MRFIRFISRKTWVKSCLVLVGLWALLAGSAGCGASSPPPSSYLLSYTYDDETRKLITILEKEQRLPEYQNFHMNFKGLIIPQTLLLRFEPFVLALSTKSKIPSVLLLDAPWVQRYGMAGWLYELETARFVSRKELVPSVAEAFSVVLPQGLGEPGKKQLVAVPPYIKGNVLFYRRDLLEKHGVKAPRTWQELRAVCAAIMAREPKIKYGLLIHVSNFLNDFYPILWGYGGRVMDGEGRLVLGEPQNRELCRQALADLQNMQGSIIPAPETLRVFAKERSLRQSFYQGEALFMINWNTRTHDLRQLISQCRDASGGCLQNFRQVGVAPIPCRQGHAQRYSNIGSFGWGVNRFTVTHDRLWVIDLGRKFINLVTDESFQLLNADMYDHVPSLVRALDKVKKPEVLMVYHDAFAAPDMVLRPRPYNRRVNNVLEKHLVEVLISKSKLRPEEALDAALKELQNMTPLE
jgi:ABC-type glycerol-3-phosphate transport system substrate-binding protein